MSSQTGSSNYCWKRVVHCRNRVTCRRGSCVWLLADSGYELARSLTSVLTDLIGIGCYSVFPNMNPVSVGIVVGKQHKRRLTMRNFHRKTQWRHGGI